MPNPLTFDSADAETNFDEIFHVAEKLKSCQGVSQTDILELPAKLATLFNQLLRAGEMSQQDLAAALRATPTETVALIQQLTDKGYLNRHTASDSNEPMYKINLTHTRRRRVTTDVWDKLDL